LLWNPYLISEPVSEEYLSKSQESLQGGNGVTGLPLGAHIRDDEQVKFTVQVQFVGSKRVLVNLEELPIIEKIQYFVYFLL
jgi:hypothetical protein